MFLGERSMLSKSGDPYQAGLTKFGGTNTGSATYSSFWMQSRKFSFPAFITATFFGNSHISHALTVGLYKFERYHGWQGNLL